MKIGAKEEYRAARRGITGREIWRCRSPGIEMGMKRRVGVMEKLEKELGSLD